MDKNDRVLLDSAREILGVAAVSVLKQGVRASPAMLYALILSWEERAEAHEKPAYQLALKILSKKLN